MIAWVLSANAAQPSLDWTTLVVQYGTAAVPVVILGFISKTLWARNQTYEALITEKVVPALTDSNRVIADSIKLLGQVADQPRVDPAIFQRLISTLEANERNAR